MTEPIQDLDRFADLIVGFGANVQPGQVVSIGAELGQEHLVRALAVAAYRHGARFVDATYFDPYVKRARLLHAEEETLDFVPPGTARNKKIPISFFSK